MGTEGADFRVIAGRYRLQARIGRGGMGVVWRASDELLGRLVAVKEILADDALPEDDARRRRDRTFREARAVAQLRHPHIIVVHDVVEQDERPYLVMELIDGCSLADRIARHGPVTPAEAARIGIALLSALDTAHEAGVLHRDIKPANVLIESGTERVVLTDFGIAQVAGATTLTETGSFVGSPEYTAPERMSGVRTGPESDLWSLGALLCTVLSGESPFRRDSIGGILHAVVAAEIRPPVEAEPLEPVVRGLLERDPDRRLGAAQAERLLRAYLETGHTPEAPDAPGTSRGHRLGVGRPSRTVPQQATRPGGSEPPSGGSAVTAEAPSGRSSTRSVLLAALLIAALAAAGGSAATLLINRDGGGGGGSPGGSATTPATGGASGTSRGPSPSATTPAPSRPGSPGPGTAPSGYRTAHDPAGFSLAVPADFVRSPQGERVFYLSPEGTYRLGVKVAVPQPGGPQAVMKGQAANGSVSNPGYHDGRVTRTTHAGHPAALWEFTWNGYSVKEGARHTYDLCWEESGRLYDVWVSAPVGKVREAREYFDVALDTFSAS
ncbi:serine/threonine-protein kinase [Streptomyces malaysiense]|uniref:non-specific serine/threonine protein kinase n=1 Tax=Streptomyces malaysiense TaxID=1428626 RepID=A0A1J4Q4S2_9ACTN|nr:serine/threonine-protein kinase [Streptomyces malaysiense]OIK28179.1 serine/threonine protein kinase [Streptomyces malaysiense]